MRPPAPAQHLPLEPSGRAHPALGQLHPRRAPASRRQQRVLKRALFLSAFAALSDPTSRAYYDRKRAQGKRHNAALICLARRRVDVLFAMLHDGSLYQAPPAPGRLIQVIGTPPGVKLGMRRA